METGLQNLDEFLNHFSQRVVYMHRGCRAIELDVWDRRTFTLLHLPPSFSYFLTPTVVA